MGVNTQSLLKLDLFCRGIRVASGCKLPIRRRTRGGLGSGLELRLGDTFVNVPVDEGFARSSPYQLVRDGEKHYIEKRGVRIARAQPVQEPKFYNKKTSSGKPMGRIGVMQGSYVGIYPSGECGFWVQGKNCRFCSIGLNLGSTEEPEKSVEDVVETVRAARKEMGITFVHFNTGYRDGKAAEEILPFVSAVKRMGLMVGVQCPPADDFTVYDRLKSMGVEHVSFCFEIFNPDIFREICPGKHEHIGQKRFFRAIEYCVSVFGRGRVTGEIIAGLEPPVESIKAINKMASMGALTTVCVFRPATGTALEGREPPKTSDMVPVFRRMYEAAVENSIPVGIAPNLKVSIVLQPEEGREFVTERSMGFRARELQFRIMGIIFRSYFRARMIAR